MKYTIVNTTDRKHEGTIFTSEDGMGIGSPFVFKDLNFKIINKIVDGDTVHLFSYNYIVILHREVE